MPETRFDELLVEYRQVDGLSREGIEWYEKNPAPPTHFRCSSCGRTWEYPMNWEEWEREMARPNGARPGVEIVATSCERCEGPGEDEAPDA